MSQLSLSFLGSFKTTIESEPITTFGADKVRALFAYLAIESPGPHRRAELSGMFWPDFPEKKAAHNLSQSLFRLRQAIRENAESPYLLVNAQEIQFNRDNDCDIDVFQFQDLIKLADQHQHSDLSYCSICTHWLKQAVDLYRGDLLAGFFLPDSVGFEEWRLVLQEKLHSQALEALRRLTNFHEQNGNFGSVIEYARRQIALEPWREEAHIQLMHAYVKSGQKFNALRQYEIYQNVLVEELGIQPSEEVTTLYERIQSGNEIQGKNEIDGSNDIIWLSSQGERRHITTLVCSHQEDDPEEVQEHLSFCKGHCEKIFHRFGGIRALRQGGACMVYFGYPEAYEDAARRAVHSALAVNEMLKDTSPVQIGIHSGIITVGEKRGERWQDRDLVGNSLEIARDCYRLAKPGEIIITGETENLLLDEFEVERVDAIRTKQHQGFNTFRVLTERNTEKYIHWLAQTQRLTSFSGREDELNEIIFYYDSIFQKKSRVVFISGEPGIGKSRLILELKRIVPKMSTSPMLNLTNTSISPHWLITRCFSHYQNSSLFPIIGLLEQLFDFRAGDSPENRKQHLVQQLTEYKLNRPSDIWLLSFLLGIPTESAAPETITEGQREQLRKLFCTLIQKRANKEPLVIVIEDLHWCDPTSMEWIHRLIQEISSSACLIILSARPGSKTDWLADNKIHSKLLHLNLKPLTPEKSEQIVYNLAGPDLVDEKTRELIVSRADGIPLFIEELTKTMLENSIPEKINQKKSEIPVSLMDSLTTRLDRLGQAKETAQWAAVLGREFPYQLLKICVPYIEDRLQTDLRKLIEAELISPVSGLSHRYYHFQSEGSIETPSRYSFKHAMMQDAAYNSMLKNTRQSYHKRIAEMIRQYFPDYPQIHPEVMAEHYYNAGDLKNAIECWLLAGDLATSRGGLLEAQIFFDRVLNNLKPEDYNNRWQALLGRENVFCFMGKRDAQKEDILALQTIAELVKDDVKYAQSKIRMARLAASLANFQEQLSAANEAFAAADRIKNIPLEVEALAYKITALMRSDNRGPIPDAVQLLSQRIQKIKDDPIYGYAMAALALYSVETGDLAQAAQYLLQSLESVQKSKKRKFDLESQYYGHLGFTYTQIGLYDLARNALEAGLELANMMGMTRYQAYHKSNLGFVYWRLKDLDTAIALEQQALKEYTGQREIFGQAACLVYLGYIYEENGQLKQAAEHVKKAWEIFADLGVIPDMIEARAVEARLFVKQGDHSEAIACVKEVWQHLMTYGVEGLSSPCWVINCIAECLEQITVSEITSKEVLKFGYSILMDNAEKITDPHWRKTYLENVIENKQIIEKWDRVKDIH